MPRERDEWPARIKAVEREYLSARLAFSRLIEEARRTPLVLGDDLRVRDVSTASDLVEGTYVIRLFAEFETGLRRYWETVRPSHPPVRDLIDGASSRCKVSFDLTAQVHSVRKHRNALVHEREDDAQVISIGPARRWLCQFFNYLPPNW